MNPIQALKNRDLKALEAAFPTFEELSDFRTHVLPNCSSEDVRWFWQSIMTPKELETSFSYMRDALTSATRLHELTPLVDLQGGYIDGFPVMYATAEALAIIYKTFDPERHAFLKAFVAPFPQD